MPYYNLVKWKVRDADHRSRAVRNLIKLRAQLDAAVPPKDAEDNLLLASWNTAPGKLEHPGLRKAA